MRIRLEPDGLNKFNVLLPGQNRDYPIGAIWQDPFRKGGWRLKSYFGISFRDDYILNQVFDDSMKAARALGTLYSKIKYASLYKEDLNVFDLMLSDDTASD